MAMNKQQREYAKAKAIAELTEQEHNKRMTQFISESGYINPDGTIPTELWKIENDKVFEFLCDKWDNSPFNNYSEVQKTQKALREAEEKLIDYALSIAPQPVVDVLNQNRYRWDIREKLLDLAFKLDTTTV